MAAQVFFSRFSLKTLCDAELTAGFISALPDKCISPVEIR
jgi:hypothetical protein